MGMTPEEFVDYTNDEFNKRMEDKKVPFEEMVEFVEARGWKETEGFDLEGTHVPMWSKTGDLCGSVGIHVAYAQAKLADPDEEDMGLKEWCKAKRGEERYVRKFPCNKCGEPTLKYETNAKGEEFPVGYYGSETTYSGGYSSKPLMDTMIYQFILCEQCLHDFMLTFKNPPKIKTYMP